jgi:hypothetical protein
MDCIKSYEDNKIWCNYHGVSGSKYYKIFLTLIIVSIPYILLLVILISNKNNLSIIYSIIILSLFYIVIIISLFRSGFSDPGIIHRQEREFKYRPNKYSIKSVINGNLYDISFCHSCLIYKPPRTSHCALCDNCILRFDHHCNWIGHCIGQKNYGSFYILVFCLFFSCIFDIIYSLYHIIYQAKKFKNKENYNKLILWGLCVICLYNIIMLFSFIGKLFFLHTYLQIINKTFYEYLKKKFSYIPGMNPFKKHIFYICKRLVLKCPGKSFYLYFAKNPEKLKLNLNEQIEFQLDKKVKQKYDILKIDLEKINKMKNNNYLNNEIENNTKDDADVDINLIKPIQLKNHIKPSTFGETEKFNNNINDDIMSPRSKCITIIK